MQVIAEEGAVTQKIRDLCQAVLADPWFQSAQERTASFLQNESAKAKYVAVNDKGEYLQHKQAQGLTLTAEEVVEFEKLREELLQDPVARGFIEAQEEMHRVQESVGRHLAMTFELGRLPLPEEMRESGGSCGSGCGCHH